MLKSCIEFFYLINIECLLVEAISKHCLLATTTPVFLLNRTNLRLVVNLIPFIHSTSQSFVHEIGWQATQSRD